MIKRDYKFHANLVNGDLKQPPQVSCVEGKSASEQWSECAESAVSSPLSNVL